MYVSMVPRGGRPGKLCLKHHLLFYSSIPKNEPIILFKLPIIPVLFPVFAFHRCRIGHRIVKLKIMPEIISHN